LDLSRRDGIVSVKLDHSDLENPIDVYAAFEELIFDRGERRVVVDLTEVTMLTSLMIGTLVSIHLLAYENVVILSFENMHEKIATLFRLIGVDSLIDAHYPSTTHAPGKAPKA
jgi:anti-anti-sigma regulatory factor